MSADPNQPGQQPYGGAYQQPQQPYSAQYQQPYPPQHGAYPAYGVPAVGQLASWGARFVALLIDNLLLSIPLCVIMFGAVATVSEEVGVVLIMLGFLLSFIIQVAYFIYFWTTSGQTIGHRAMGLRVVREDGQPITVGTALIRWIGYTVNGLPLYLGWLWPLWDQKKQGFHDKMAGTLVIRAQ